MNNFKIEIIILILLNVAHSIFAQSGRIIQPTPTSVNSVENSQCEKGLDEVVFIQPKIISEFIKELNGLGKCEYKLNHLTKFPLALGQNFSQMQVAGVVSFERGSHYEYEWFESFMPDQLNSKISSLTNQGFYFRDVLSVTDGDCSSPTFPRIQSASEGILEILTPAASDETKERVDELKKSLDISHGTIIFLERKNNLIHPNFYNVETAALGWGENPVSGLEKIFNDFWETGAKPLAVRAYKTGNKHDFVVLTENSRIKETPNTTEYKVVRLYKNYEKTINLLANEGYQIAFDVVFGAYRFIILKKLGEQKQYQWTHPLFKNFAVGLNKIAQQGGHFVGVYSTDFNCDSIEANLLFEINSPQNKKYDYKILKMADDLDCKKKNTSSKNDNSINRIENFKNFLKDGYKVRELFYDDGINVLFERAKQ